MAVYDTFDNIEETCTVTMVDNDEKIILISALQAQIDKYQAQIDSEDKETDFVEVDKRDKFQTYLDRVNEFISVDDILLLAEKGEITSWLTAINEYYQKNLEILTEEQANMCIAMIQEIDTALISIDRKT